MCNMTNRPSTFRDLKLRSGNEVCVKTGPSYEPKVGQVHFPQKPQLDPLEVLCVKFEDNRTSTFRDMLRSEMFTEGPTP